MKFQISSSPDDAFLYVDGMLVDSLGGVHPDTQLPVTTPQTLATGNHRITLFYDNRYSTQAALSFSILSQGIMITPPGTAPLPPAAGGFSGCEARFVYRRAACS